MAVLAGFVMYFDCGGRGGLCFALGGYHWLCSCCGVGVLVEVVRFVGCAVECVPDRACCWRLLWFRRRVLLMWCCWVVVVVA